MKIQLLLLAVFCFFIKSYGQGDGINVGNYMITTFRNSDSTYGFKVYNKNHDNLVIEQKTNPYSINKKGFNERQNGVVVAFWFVKELEEGRNDIKKLTSLKAREIGITQKDL